MNTKPDNLEQRLQSLPVRAVPAHWRQEILRAACRGDRTPESGCQPGLVPWWRVWLWPCPEAWVGVAAAWVIILVLNLGVWQTERSQANQGPPPPPPVPIWMAVDEQRRLLADLDLPRRSPPQSPTPVVPRPRSCRRPETFMV